MTTGSVNASQFPMMFIVYGGGLGYTMSLYAIVHMVGDSVPVSDQLLYLLGSAREAAWNDCSHGVLLAPNRTCYVPRHAIFLYAMVWLHVSSTVLLLVRGATLPGAMGGLSLMLYADWSHAASLQ
ncbi:hypothetical protein V5799_017379, partial [Amblyomma americanum]